ncbi:hypothetical protein DMB66_24350 [Actinoplanes sp. ATCC 53533]|nr:hypothetical protein DMB66_24350 [Actinoplanes sp. ATCC 53533]
MSSWRVAAAALASGAAFAGLPAAAATADTVAPTGDLICVPQGASIFECQLRIAGGTAPYSTTWSGATFTETFTTAAVGRCNPAKAYRISVVITDAGGAQATDLAHFVCKGGPPV